MRVYGWSARALWAIALAALLTPTQVQAQTQVQAPSGTPDSRTLTLEQAVVLALDHNRELADARLGLEAAQGQVREAWGEVMPSLDAVASYTRNLSVPTNFLPRIFFDPDASPDELVPVWRDALMVYEGERGLQVANARGEVVAAFEGAYAPVILPQGVLTHARREGGAVRWMSWQEVTP